MFAGLCFITRQWPTASDAGKNLGIGLDQNQPPYTPDIAPSDWHLLRTMDHFLHGGTSKVTGCLSLSKKAILGNSQSFHTGSDLRLLRLKFLFSCQGEEASKFKKRSFRATINWDFYTSLANFWEDTVTYNIDEEYDRFVHHLCDSKGVDSLKTTKRRLSPDTLELIRQRGAARA
ncbi:unnamed protein product [Heligmosomoides polygyrus]|uniref:Uncharacterized protein n=1 Tax=Heligmosomoides polygyrus TaxID=6339 RepID=A0A183G3A2_HELPZ|nr:unnamed protein product [Heligmosomoides polygyrus]